MISQKIKHILDSYEDYELAFLYKYKIDSYSIEIKNEILRYIFLRGLDSYKIDRLIQEIENKKFEDSQDRCPRCKSKNILSQEVEYQNSRVNLDQIYKNQNICNVCGYWIDDPNNLRPYSNNLWGKILGWLRI